jgi:germination protein M
MQRIRKILIFSVLALLLFLTFTLLSCTPKVGVKLYFSKYTDNETYLEPEIRQIIQDKNFYKSIVQELIKGPQNKDLYPTLPSNTVVNSVKIENDLAIVDFSKEIITNTKDIPHSSTTEILALFSIVNTLTEFKEIKKVRITIKGKKNGQIEGLYIQDFWGHVGIYEDFTRNEEVIGKNISE